MNSTEMFIAAEIAVRLPSSPHPRPMMRIEPRVPGGDSLLGLRGPWVQEELDWSEVVSWAEICL